MLSMSAVIRDDEHARLVAIEERHRLRLQAVEHPDAQVAQEALAGVVDGHELLAPDEVVDDDDHAVGDDCAVQRPGAAVAEAAIGGEASPATVRRRCTSSRS